MIIKTIRAVAAIAVCVICLSCDILRNAPFEVSAWSPGGGCHDAPGTLKVSVAFSRDPDRSSVEKNFSLAGNGEHIRGVFRWEGRSVDFLPLSPLESNRDYSVRIAANARDTKGLSLDRDFEGRFSTRPDSTRISVVSCRPSAEGSMDESRGSCVIGFSVPVSLESLRNNASFSPSAAGAWHLEEGGAIAVFTPSEPWPQGRRFEMRLSASLAGRNGMGMGKDFITVFTAGAQREPPRLAGALRITKTGEAAELTKETPGLFFENSGWEREDRLRLVFSVPVDLLSAGTALSVEGASPLVLEMPCLPGTEAGFSHEAVFRFEKLPQFGSRFSLRLKRGVKDSYGNESEEDFLFRIAANGTNSKPPSLVGMRIPMSPANSSGYDLRAYGTDQLFADLPVNSANYPYLVKTAAWIELYFDSAPGASIDPFSLMEMFRVETSNNVLLFSPLALRTGNFTVSDPYVEWEHCQRLEIAGTLTNTTNAGLVHFLVNQGLRDSAGNSSEKPFRISLVK